MGERRGASAWVRTGTGFHSGIEKVEWNEETKCSMLRIDEGEFGV